MADFDCAVFGFQSFKWLGVARRQPRLEQRQDQISDQLGYFLVIREPLKPKGLYAKCEALIVRLRDLCVCRYTLTLRYVIPDLGIFAQRDTAVQRLHKGLRVFPVLLRGQLWSYR
jgi:hypothetical protein